MRARADAPLDPLRIDIDGRSHPLVRGENLAPGVISMNFGRILVIVAVVSIVAASPCAAQPGGTQLSRDGNAVLVQKDVGAERWAITMNLEDRALTGNVFFTDARPPTFIACDPVDLTYDPATATLLLIYDCFAADDAPGAFSPVGWTLIREDVTLNANFFFPSTNSCDLTSATNGASLGAPVSYWQCGGNGGDFRSQFFLDGGGNTDTVGPFTYSVSEDGCGFQTIQPTEFVARFAYSPTLDVLNWFEPNFLDGGFFVSTCRRTPL